MARSTSAGPRFSARAEIGVHRALAIRRDQDEAAGGRWAVLRRGGGEVDAHGADIVGEEAADFVGLHLADIGRRDRRRRRRRRCCWPPAARHDRRGAHDAVEPLRLRLVDQAHRALVQVVGDEEIILGTGEARPRWRCRGRARRSGETSCRDSDDVSCRVAFASGAAPVKAYGLAGRLGAGGPARARASGRAARGGPRSRSSGARRCARASLLASSVAGGESPAVSMTMRGCESSARRCSSSASSQMTLKYWMTRCTKSQLGRPRLPCSSARGRSGSRPAPPPCPSGDAARGAQLAQARAEGRHGSPPSRRRMRT